MILILEVLFQIVISLGINLFFLGHFLLDQNLGHVLPPLDLLSLGLVPFLLLLPLLLQLKQLGLLLLPYTLKL